MHPSQATSELQETINLKGIRLLKYMRSMLQAWNVERTRVVHESVTRYLLPALMPELRACLAARARETVACRVSDTLWDLASKAPLKVNP